MSDPTCALWFCPAPPHTQGLCERHYRSFLEHGEVRLDPDARLLLSYAQRTQVLFTRIAEKCWQDQGGVRVCRYCGELSQHNPACIVLAVESLRAI